MNPNSSTFSTITRLAVALGVTAIVVLLTMGYGFTQAQVVSSSVFTLIIVSTMCFWDFHLPIAFVGIAVLTMLNVMDLPRLIMQSHLDVILFLVGMMIMVGILRDLGLFSWVIVSVISSPGMTARRFVLTVCALGAVMSCMVDEMSTSVFIAALIFQVCDTLNVRPLPFIFMAVMSINIGTAGTMLGNPVGILIGQNAAPPLSFVDFMRWSFPLMLAEFVVIMLFLLWTFRREIRAMNMEMGKRREMGMRLGPIVDLPFAQGLLVLLLLMVMLSTHTIVESGLGLPRNTMLIMSPLLLSGLMMLWRRDRVRHYIENDVQWVNLIFFMLLFVVAGTLEYTGVTTRLAGGFAAAFGPEKSAILPAVLGISALGSAFIENIVFVAAFMPVVVQLGDTVLLWALLHGACLGGNITMIGSTANMTAVAMLEKRYWTRVDFWVWLRTGFMVGVLSLLVAWAGLHWQAGKMPSVGERMRAAGMEIAD